MGLRDYLARRKAEKRIQRRGTRLYTPREEGSDLDRTKQRISDRSARIVRRFYDETQQRKGEGKRIVMERINRLIGNVPSMGRELLRDPTVKKTNRKIRIPPTPGSAKIRKRRRKK